MRMRYCRGCRLYTLKERCLKCGGETVSPHPAKFSPLDHYGRYRRDLKREVLKSHG